MGQHLILDRLFYVPVGILKKVYFHLSSVTLVKKDTSKKTQL